MIRRLTMIFHITQTHNAESCPRDEGGLTVLTNPEAAGVNLKAMYGAFAEHIIYYVVEADSIEAVNQFLLPGFTRCTAKISAVSEESPTG
jgi:hypothetical protein